MMQSDWSVADPAAGKGGPRNMKSMRPPLAAIFFMTYFYKPGEAMTPSAPLPRSATAGLGSQSQTETLCCKNV